MHCGGILEGARCSCLASSFLLGFHFKSLRNPQKDQTPYTKHVLMHQWPRVSLWTLELSMLRIQLYPLGTELYSCSAKDSRSGTSTAMETHQHHAERSKTCKWTPGDALCCTRYPAFRCGLLGTTMLKMVWAHGQS